MEAPITMGIYHKPEPELIVPYWIDGLGSWRESVPYSEAERATLAYCAAPTEGNRLSFQDINDDVAKGATPKLTCEKWRIRLVHFGVRGPILALAQPRWKVAELARGFWTSAATINGRGTGNVVPS